MCSFQCKMQDNHEEDDPITESVSDDKTETLQDEIVSILLFKYLYTVRFSSKVRKGLNHKNQTLPHH